jgi:glycosyl transferase family 25
MKNINDIKHIYYINLESRSDRKSKFEDEIKKINIQATRFNAIKNKIGALGCSLSHLNLLKLAKLNNLDHILIMEDDIVFMKPEIFINSLNNFLSSEINFDVLLIAGNNMGSYIKIDDFCVKISKCQTTTGYLVKKKYYDKLIENFEQGILKLTNNLNRLNDFAIDQYWTNLQLIDNWYLLTPLTVSQRPDYSDIEKRIINYNMVMLDLDKQYLRKVGIIKEKEKQKEKISNTFNDIIKNI